MFLGKHHPEVSLFQLASLPHLTMSPGHVDDHGISFRPAVKRDHHDSCSLFNLDIPLKLGLVLSNISNISKISHISTISYMSNISNVSNT